jgi:hypothetical protein
MKNAWSDKFSLPTVDELKSLQPKPLQSMFQKCRQKLLEHGHTEVVQWQGVPWRWSLVYTAGKDDLDPMMNFQPSAEPSAASPRAFAYLIPDPARLQLCIPLTTQQIEQVGLKKFKKPIRDGIAFARSVGGVWWPTWEIPSLAALDEVLELAKKKLNLESKPTAVARA